MTAGGGSRAAVIAATMRREIANGNPPGGSLLPAERRLAQRFACARETLRRALGHLRAEGLVLPAAGRGWMVRGGAGAHGSARVLVLIGHSMGLLATAQRIVDRLEAIGCRPLCRQLAVARGRVAGPRMDLSGLRLSSYDGLVLHGCGHMRRQMPELVRLVHGTGMPCIATLGRDDLLVDEIDCDPHAIAVLAVEEALRRGRRHIAYIGQAQPHRQSNGMRQRLLGYHDVLQRHGLRPDVLLLGGVRRHGGGVAVSLAQVDAWLRRRRGRPVPDCLIGSLFGYPPILRTILAHLHDRTGLEPILLSEPRDGTREACSTWVFSAPEHMAQVAVERMLLRLQTPYAQRPAERILLPPALHGDWAQ